MEDSPKRILVVDDDQDTCTLMADILREEGYDVVASLRGEEALQLLEEQEFDLVLSDIKMPRVSGIELLLHVRKKNLDTEVILITAYASVETAVQALRGHAFDYMTKPFPLTEFRQRVRRALDLRLDSGRPHIVQVHEELAIDHNARRIWVDGEAIKLTRLEFDVLSYLFERQGCVVAPEELLIKVWGRDPAEESSMATVKSCISRLRKKIGDDARDPTHIINAWGMGYQIPK